ncbi:MAG: TolC family protein [Verrucomicrobiota bacterium]
MIVNWELDVFGQVRAGIRAANARIGVAAVNVDDMRNLVVADLTKAVIDWRQAQQTVKFTESLLKAEDEQILLFDYRTKAGLIDASFLERARAERAQRTCQT